MKQQAPKVARDDEGLARLRTRGVTRALTLWPEWGVAFTKLDKRVENRPMPPFRNLGLHALFATAAESGWKVYRPAEPVYTLRKRAPKELVHRAAGGVLALDYEAEREGDIKIRVPGDIITSAITFTAVIGGFHPPTDDPKIPWQVGTRGSEDFEEDPSYAWILEDLEVLDTPVTCPGMQGVWTL